MKKYADFVTDARGNALNAATVTVVNYPSGTAATIYSDDGTTTIASGVITTSATGYFEFYAPPGAYDLQVRVAGALLRTISNVQIDEGLSEEVASIAALKALKGMGSLQYTVRVLGYYSAGDGGGGEFYWDSASSATDNGGTVIAADAGGVGRWKRVYSGAVNVEWFGVLESRTGAQNTPTLVTIFDTFDSIYLPGLYPTNAVITIDRSDVTVTGAGMGVSGISNGGTGNGLTVTSGGGANPSLVRIVLKDFSIVGNGSSNDGLYLYDVHRSVVENIDSRSNGRHGIYAEMTLVSNFTNCHTYSNGGKGFYLNAGTKATVEYTSNANWIRGLSSQSNTGSGVTVARSNGNIFTGGDVESNGNPGVLIDGAQYNVFDGVWLEGNTTSHFKTQQSTSPSTLNSNYNKLINSLTVGAPTVDIANGTGNYIGANAISGNVNITNGSATPNTVFAEQSVFSGTLTDSGDGTINTQNPTAMYWKNGSVKRLQINVGASATTFDADQTIIDLRRIRSISTSGTSGKNLSGYVDIADANTTGAVTFGTAEPDASYNVVLGSWDVSGAPATNSHITWITSRATTGFTINLGAAPGAGTTLRVFWVLVRV